MAVAITAFPLVQIITALPRRVRVRIREFTPITGRLDYPKRPIHMYIDSPAEFARVRSCIKEPETVAWLEEFMGPDDVLYDIGANVGAYSLIAASRIGNGKGKVLSFEPSYLNYFRLNQNIALNGLSEHIATFPVALSDRSGMTIFRFSSTRIGDALHSMDGVSQHIHATPSVASSHVLMDRIDSLVERFHLPLPSLIKLDVDGPEYEVLLGAGKLLQHEGLRSIALEMEADESRRKRIEELLVAHGWRLYRRQKHYGNAVDEDWVWIRA